MFVPLPEPGSDLERLNKTNRSLLTIKLDGQIEGAMFICLQRGIGAQEAMQLLAYAFLREIHARRLGRDEATQLFNVAVNEIYAETPPAAETVPRVVN